jgi:formylglycine-generating enzyme required for sulfatase activity
MLSRPFGFVQFEEARWPPASDYLHVPVSWPEAAAFCDWLTQRQRGRFRLPTEDEWEKAARGWSYRVYPWGDTYDGTQAGHSTGRPMPCGATPTDRSPFGILGMGGGAWEWCAEEYPADGHLALRLLKGCLWNFDPDTFRIAHRRVWREDGRCPHIGFRVVWESESE